MPIYEYQCCRCGEEFETLVLSSGEAVACPKCTGGEVKRLMSVSCSKSSGGFSGSSSSGSSCGCCSGGHHHHH